MATDEGVKEKPDNPWACPDCGAQMKQIAIDFYRCINPDCSETWEAKEE